MERSVLKMDAKAAMREAVISPYGVTVIYGIILFILSAIQSFLDIWKRILDKANGYIDPAQLIAFIGSSIVFFIISFVITTIIQFGYSSFCLKVSNRDATMSYMDLFSSVRYLLKAIGLSVVTGVLVLLWSLLFIVPGIIAAYRYSQAVFVLVEDPRKGIMQCIQESKDMMVGHKFEFFVLQLSFLLWELMGIFTCGLGYIYVYPYMNVTKANYYNAVKPKTAFYGEYTMYE